MKTVLIRPPEINRVWVGIPKFFNRGIFLFPPLGIMQIKGFVEKESNHTVKIYDSLVYDSNYEGVARFVKKYSPEVVGISTFTHSLADVIKTARRIKKVSPKVHITLGGPHTYSFPKKSEYLFDSGYVDSIIFGDGEEKVGYGLGEEGKIYPFNKEAEYEFSLGLCDDLKFNKNKKSYQEMIFEIAGFEYKEEEYVLSVDSKQDNFSKEFLEKNDLTDDNFIVGLNIGCGKVFPNKKWKVRKFIKLAKKLIERERVKVLILGGPDEKERYNMILKELSKKVIGTGINNSLKEFIAIVNCCDVVVSGDTLAMHIGIVLEKRVIALFGPTSPQEVELYGRGEKIVTGLNCSPCYRNNCNKSPDCMDNITVEQVLGKI